MDKKMIIPKRNFFNEREYTLDYKNQVLIVNESLLKSMQSKKPGSFGGFRKMTGSALGDIMHLTDFNSEFAAFSRLCNFKMPVLDDKYVRAGIVLESKIIEKIEKHLGHTLNRYPAEKYNYDFFTENELFGGLPDGYSEKLKMVFEIKTSGEKNLENWNKYGVNPGYIKQAQLYTYLMGVKNFAIVACFLKEEDYLNPETIDINQRYVKNWNMQINEAQVQDDIDTCIKWFKKYTKTGISPKWNEKIDADLIEFLACKNFNEWEDLYKKWVENGKATAKYE
ncbi:MAGa7180 family putative nuclease [Metamycoplasma equirhinis]|uniref:MAGa7180 family putative nuclease n=1 Tax=Metamycoplasma equirhinis TaxID=92402 RepID=UPI00359370FB